MAAPAVLVQLAQATPTPATWVSPPLSPPQLSVAALELPAPTPLRTPPVQVPLALGPGVLLEEAGGALLAALGQELLPWAACLQEQVQEQGQQGWAGVHTCLQEALAAEWVEQPLGGPTSAPW